jgi:hypothetical protein
MTAQRGTSDQRIAISDGNRVERLIEDLRKIAKLFQFGESYKTVVAAADLIERLRVDAERADRYLKLLRDWTGCEPEDLDAATAPKQVADSAGRAEEDGNG